MKLGSIIIRVCANGKLAYDGLPSPNHPFRTGEKIKAILLAFEHFIIYKVSYLPHIRYNLLV